MKGACCNTRSRTVTLAGAAAVPSIFLALLPKCPVCVAAYLTAIGVSVELAPAVRPVAFAVLGAAVVALMIVRKNGMPRGGA